MGRWMRPRDRAASSAPGCGRRGGGERGNRGRATASVFFRRAGGGQGIGCGDRERRTAETGSGARGQEEVPTPTCVRSVTAMCGMRDDGGVRCSMQ
jgi:hypothetical protein